MINKIEHMLKMQDEMNTVVHPDWKNQNFDWRRAAWIECAELMEHIGWKWWKKQEPNLEQAKLELVDIWHFVLSLISKKLSAANVYSVIYCSKNKNEEYSLLQQVEILVQAIIMGSLEQIIFEFSCCCEKIGLSFDELYKLYVGKNVLNKFRQANGYKEGTYIKTWFNKEDNDYLYELLNLLDSDHEDFAEGIEISLTSAYEVVVEANSDL